MPGVEKRYSDLVYKHQSSANMHVLLLQLDEEVKIQNTTQYHEVPWKPSSQHPFAACETDYRCSSYPNHTLNQPEESTSESKLAETQKSSARFSNCRELVSWKENFPSSFKMLQVRKLCCKS